MLQRAPETAQRAIKLPRFIGHVKLHEKYCRRGDKSFQVILYGCVTNIDRLRLCEIHIDVICPDKIMLIIILVIILKCYDQVSLSIAIESDFTLSFYGFTLIPLEEYC